MKPNMHNVAICVAEKSCKQCGAIADAIVVNRGPHHTLYCGKCGSYVKHANDKDKKYIYAKRVSITDNTPIKVCSLYLESERTMFK